MSTCHGGHPSPHPPAQGAGTCHSNTRVFQQRQQVLEALAHYRSTGPHSALFVTERSDEIHQ